MTNEFRFIGGKQDGKVIIPSPADVQIEIEGEKYIQLAFDQSDTPNRVVIYMLTDMRPWDALQQWRERFKEKDARDSEVEPAKEEHGQVA